MYAVDPETGKLVPLRFLELRKLLRERAEILLGSSSQLHRNPHELGEYLIGPELWHEYEKLLYEQGIIV